MNAFWAIPCVFFIRIIGYFKVIRIGTIRSDRIGHFAIDAQEQLSIVSDPKIKIWDLFWIRKNTTNKQWRKMICRTLPVHNLLEWIDKWNRKISGGDIHKRPSTFNNSRDLNNSIISCPNKFLFSQSEIEYCKDWLKSKGWVPRQPIACFMIRDSEFLSKDPHFALINDNSDSKYHSYRDSDLNDFLPSMEWLTEQGVFVLRMGKIMRSRVETQNDQIIDYAFDDTKSDLLDIWLFANCNYCITTGTGPCMLSLIYNKPILFSNILPFDFKQYTGSLTIAPKKLYNTINGSLLNLREHIDHNYYRSEDYQSNDLRIENLSSEEILEDVQDFYAKHNKTRTLDAVDHARQKAVWKQILTNQKEPILKKKNIHPECEFSYTWLRRQNEEFFQN